MEDLANASLYYNIPSLPHRMYDMVGSIGREAPPTLHPELAGLTRDPYLRQSNVKPFAYVYISVGDLLELT